MANHPVLQITEGEWTSRKCYDILGVRIPAYMTSDPALLADHISSFQTRPDDVFVVTYPKSGSSWMREVVWQMYNNGHVSKENITDRFSCMEIATRAGFLKTELKSLPSPRLIWSHLPYSIVPKSSDLNTQCKYVYVARNPKDVLVSYFHWLSSLKHCSDDGYNGPLEFLAKLFIEGNAGFGCWSDHVLDWWKHKDDPNVLFLKYEDLQKDLPSNVRLIAEFLGKPLSDELIDRIAEQCTFKGMKKNPASYEVMREGKNTVSFLRKGQVGDWKNYFTPELNERFEEEVLGKFKGSGLEFDYEI